MEISSTSTHKISFLSVFFYFLAGLGLILSLLILWGALTVRAGISNSLMPIVQATGMGMIFGLLINQVTSGLTFIGVLLTLITLGLSAALFAAGRSAARSAQLADRVARLEIAIAALEKPEQP